MVGEQEQLRVLVVDDEPNIVDVVSMALRHNGFDVEAAGTGVRRADPRVANGARTCWCST